MLADNYYQSSSTSEDAQGCSLKALKGIWKNCVGALCGLYGFVCVMGLETNNSFLFKHAFTAERTHHKYPHLSITWVNHPWIQKIERLIPPHKATE